MANLRLAYLPALSTVKHLRITLLDRAIGLEPIYTDELDLSPLIPALPALKSFRLDAPTGTPPPNWNSPAENAQGYRAIPHPFPQALESVSLTPDVRIQPRDLANILSSSTASLKSFSCPCSTFRLDDLSDVLGVRKQHIRHLTLYGREVSLGHEASSNKTRRFFDFVDSFTRLETLTLYRSNPTVRLIETLSLRSTAPFLRQLFLIQGDVSDLHLLHNPVLVSDKFPRLEKVVLVSDPPSSSCWDSERPTAQYILTKKDGLFVVSHTTSRTTLPSTKYIGSFERWLDQEGKIDELREEWFSKVCLRVLKKKKIHLLLRGSRES